MRLAVGFGFVSKVVDDIGDLYFRASLTNAIQRVIMETTDIIMIAAVFLGPTVAVRVTRYLDDRKEVKNRKIFIYKTLMATRASSLSQPHVEALNSIDLEFSSKRKEKGVRDAWKQYLDLLGDRSIPPELWDQRRIDLLIQLLDRMGKCLGYDFDQVQIKNGIYSPELHGEIESDLGFIRRGFRELLEGKRTIPMFVTNLYDYQPAKAIDTDQK